MFFLIYVFILLFYFQLLFLIFLLFFWYILNSINFFLLSSKIITVLLIPLSFFFYIVQLIIFLLIYKISPFYQLLRNQCKNVFFISYFFIYFLQLYSFSIISFLLNFLLKQRTLVFFFVYYFASSFFFLVSLPSLHSCLQFHISYIKVHYSCTLFSFYLFLSPLYLYKSRKRIIINKKIPGTTVFISFPLFFLLVSRIRVLFYCKTISFDPKIIINSKCF